MLAIIVVMGLAPAPDPEGDSADVMQADPEGDDPGEPKPCTGSGCGACRTVLASPFGLMILLAVAGLTSRRRPPR